MKKITYIVVCMFLLYGTGLVSCKKNLSEIIPATGFNPTGNKAPIAEAGNSQIIILPVDSVVLNGTESKDTDGEISKYEWYKIEGPASFLIQQPDASITTVNNLVKGDYWFELKVTDDKGLASIDRVMIEVQDSVFQQDPGECDITSMPRFTASLTPVGNLSFPQTPYTAACGNKLFFAGGAHNYGAVDIYDIVQQTWDRAQLSQPRTNIAMVSCGNKVFFAGGNNNDIWFDIIDIYDITTGNWTVKHLSEPKSYLAAGALGDKVFFAGGITEEGWNQTADIEIYDIPNDQWSKTTLSEPKMGVTAVTAGDKIYFAGGWNYLSGFYDPMIPLRSVDIYDASTNTWSNSNLNFLTGGVTGVVVNDRIYWGGMTKFTGMVEIWDTRNGVVTTTCLSYPRSNPAVIARNEYVAFFPTASPGSVVSYDGAPNHFDIYNTVTGAKAAGLINQSITGAAIISVNNKIYMAGGFTPAGYSDKVYQLNW